MILINVPSSAPQPHRRQPANVPHPEPGCSCPVVSFPSVSVIVFHHASEESG